MLLCIVGDGWQVPIEGHATLQDLCLGPSQYWAPPLSQSHQGDSTDQDPALSKSPSSDEVDPASNGPLEIAHISTTSTAVLATSPSSSTLNDTPPVPSSMGPTRTRSNSHSRRTKPGHIPRPKNAFILYRSWFYKNRPPPQTQDGKKLNQNELSKQVAVSWNAMSEEDQEPFKKMYLEELARHKEMYPDYTYEPSNKSSRKSAKKKKRATQPKRKRSRSVDSDSDDESVSSFGSNHSTPPPTARNLRPRRCSQQLPAQTSIASPTSSPSPSPSPTPTPPTPTPSLSSGSESDMSDEEDGFVSTEDIPAVTLPPSILDTQTKASELYLDETTFATGCQPLLFDNLPFLGEPYYRSDGPIPVDGGMDFAFPDASKTLFDINQYPTLPDTPSTFYFPEPSSKPLDIASSTPWLPLGAPLERDEEIERLWEQCIDPAALA
ncbi:specific transcriptional repressor [Coprinopsis cinerea AmutBmut pab1-1]|nr:specific transcriptional repressor [Coprinopsis cinerea AmutBmut pab1-1]